MARGFCSEVEPQTDLEKVLYTIDELTGLVAATALMRPSKSILDTSVSSVKKKWKQKSFAAGVNREVIEQGAAKLGYGHGPTDGGNYCWNAKSRGCNRPCRQPSVSLSRNDK